MEQEIVAQIVQLASDECCATAPPLCEYIRYLRATRAHFQFVDKYFPETNTSLGANVRNANCKQNTIEELFAIAHHLFVLKSHGVAGDFVKFGCFKGFSSSLLSFACGLLGTPMHLYDSFEGLPSSTSYHQAGDFAGGGL